MTTEEEPKIPWPPSYPSAIVPPKTRHDSRGLVPAMCAHGLREMEVTAEEFDPSQMHPVARKGGIYTVKPKRGGITFARGRFLTAGGLCPADLSGDPADIPADLTTPADSECRADA